MRKPADVQRVRLRTQAKDASDTQAAAVSYAAAGWSVIPVEPRGKRPLVAWLEFQQRIASAEEIASWFRKWPEANIGIVTGTISQLVVIDVDPQHGGTHNLEAMEQAQGALPRTLEVHTGGGGRHLYFAYPSVRLYNRVGIRPGVDLRSDGGYVVAPPSVHPSGQRYRWLPDQGPQDLSPVPIPAWFLEAMRAPGQAGHSLKHWRRIAREGVAEGQRNSMLASLSGHLLWHGVDPEVVLDLMLAWNQARCRPPLPDDEAARVVQSIARLHATRSGENSEV